MKAQNKKWIMKANILGFIVFTLILVLLLGCNPGDLPDYVPQVIVTGIMDETITFENGDVTLAGTLDLPAGEGPFPAIVTVHGSPPVTRNDKNLLQTSYFFVQHGFAVLRYDKRGATAGESTGKFQGIDANEAGITQLTKLADDGIAGVEYLKNHNKIDPERIGVMGLSQAGWIVALAAERSEDIAFFVAFSGPTSTVGQEIYYSTLTIDEGKFIQEASDMAKDFDGEQGYDPMPSLEKVDIPGLWIFGGKDDSIPIPLILENLDSLKGQGKDFTYIYYSNADHSLTDVDTGQVYPFMLDSLKWLEEKFDDISIIK